MVQQKMKRLECSKCGFKTNAVAEGATKVLCAGCFKNSKVSSVKKGWLKDEMEAAMIEYENLPDWMKIPENRMKGVGSYAELP